MQFDNFFEILGLNCEPKIILEEDEIENQYCLIQMNLMKNQASINAEEFEKKFDLINKASEVLKNEKQRIEHAFEILEFKGFFPNEIKTQIEKKIEQNLEIMEFFFEINEQIDNIENKNQIDQIKENLMIEKNSLLKILNDFFEKKEYENSYETFLKMKYVFRALEIISQKENLLNGV